MDPASEFPQTQEEMFMLHLSHGELASLLSAMVQWDLVRYEALGSNFCEPLMTQEHQDAWAAFTKLQQVWREECKKGLDSRVSSVKEAAQARKAAEIEMYKKELEWHKRDREVRQKEREEHAQKIRLGRENAKKRKELGLSKSEFNKKMKAGEL